MKVPRLLHSIFGSRATQQAPPGRSAQGEDLAAAFCDLLAAAGSRAELIEAGVRFFQERFHARQAALYVPAPENRAAARLWVWPLPAAGLNTGERLPLDADHPIARALVTGRTQISAAASSEGKTEPSGLEQRVLPLAANGEITGALALDFHPPPDEAAARLLERLALPFAAALARLPEDDPKMASPQVVRAALEIARAENAGQVFEIVGRNLAGAAYATTILIVQDGEFKAAADRRFAFDLDPEAVETFLAGRSGSDLLLVDDFEHPPEGAPAGLVAFPRRMGWEAAAYLPVMQAGRLAALFAVGASEPAAINREALAPYRNLADLTAISLEKIEAAHQLRRRVEVLQTLSAVSQAISLETDPQALYRLIHEQVFEFMGAVNFTIALYHAEDETIEIAYSYEGGEPLIVEPFPVGEGLTSILIRTREPLLIVKDTEQRAAELGAKIVGKPAKSWLGVPLMLTGEVIGAVIVQDIEQEGRFDEDDVDLLTNLASQIAVVVANARLLEEVADRAMQEEVINRVAAQAFSSLDLESLLRKSVTEIGQAVDCSQVQIRLAGSPRSKTGGSILF